MNTKNIILFLVMLSFTVSSALATTFIAPTTGSAVSGSTVLINVTSTGALRNLSNCSVTGTSALTADSISLTLLPYNTTGNYSQANVTFNSTARLDASDWVFTGTCYNLTNYSVNEAITSITITLDNNVPSLTTATPADGTMSRDNIVTFTAITSGATSATVTYDGTAYTMAKSGSSFTYDISTLENIRQWYITLSDGLNTTTSSTYNYNKIVGGTIALDPTVFDNVVASANPPANNNNTWIVILCVLTALYFFGGKTGKRK